MRKITDRIVSIWNQPADKVKPSIFAAIAVIVMMLSKNANSRLAIILGAICALVMLTYTIMSILKHEDITKIFIYLISAVIGVFISIMYYFKDKGIEFYAFAVIVTPVILIPLFIASYVHVKKSGDKDKIKQVKLGLMFTSPFLVVVSIFSVYLLFFK